MEAVIAWSPLVWASYRRLLEEEKFDVSKIGERAESCDEAPLYSRHSQLSFLARYSREQRVNAILLMALWYWRDAEASLAEFGRGRRYMQFISVWNWLDDCDEEEQLPCPYFFFCNKNPVRFSRCLALRVPKTVAGRRVERFFSGLGLGDAVKVFEDLETDPGNCRILVDFDLHSSPRKILLGSGVRVMAR